MSTVEIYDSQGRPYGEPEAERNERIRDLNRHGIVFTIEFGQPIDIVCYFRAYETGSGRREQYYATFSGRASGNVLPEFLNSVRERADELGLDIEDTAAGENVLSNLEQGGPNLPGSSSAHRKIESKLAQSRRIRLGVGTYEEAVSVISRHAGSKNALRAAIGGNAKAAPVSDYDLVIEKGSYTGLEPLGDTDRILNPEKYRPDPTSGSSGRKQFLKYGAIGVGALLVTVIALALVIGGLAMSGMWYGPFSAYMPGVSSVDNATVQGASNDLVVEGSTPANGAVLVFYDGNGRPIKTVDVAFESASSGGGNKSAVSRPAGALAFSVQGGNGTSTASPSPTPTATPTQVPADTVGTKDGRAYTIEYTEAIPSRTATIGVKPKGPLGPLMGSKKKNVSLVTAIADLRVNGKPVDSGKKTDNATQVSVEQTTISVTGATSTKAKRVTARLGTKPKKTKPSYVEVTSGIGENGTFSLAFDKSLSRGATYPLNVTVRANGSAAVTTTVGVKVAKGSSGTPTPAENTSGNGQSDEGSTASPTPTASPSTDSGTTQAAYEAVYVEGSPVFSDTAQETIRIVLNSSNPFFGVNGSVTGSPDRIRIIVRNTTSPSSPPIKDKNVTASDGTFGTEFGCTAGDEGKHLLEVWLVADGQTVQEREVYVDLSGQNCR